MTKMNNLLVRSLSGVALLVVMLGALFVSKYTFGVLLAVIGCGVMHEFFRLSEYGPSRGGKWVAALIVVVSVTIALLLHGLCFWAVWPLVAILFFIELFRKSTHPLENIAVTVCGIAYAAIPMALLADMSVFGGEYEPRLILLFFLTVWINDVFAYLVGTSMGHHHLMERISPHKSWEGFWGGVLFATAFTAATGHITEGDALVCGGFGLIVSVSSVLGDLVESMFKRAANVKDSGNILPGHGGFMDRFDAMLLSLPFAYCYLILLTPFNF